jgi:hypothetical protein
MVDGAVDHAAPATGGTPPTTGATTGGTATGSVAGLLTAPGTTPVPAADGMSARAVGAEALSGGATTPSERSSAIAAAADWASGTGAAATSTGSGAGSGARGATKVPPRRGVGTDGSGPYASGMNGSWNSPLADEPSGRVAPT